MDGKKRGVLGAALIKRAVLVLDQGVSSCLAKKKKGEDAQKKTKERVPCRVASPLQIKEQLRGGSDRAKKSGTKRKGTPRNR